jgi:hypothetical protein
MLQRIPSGQQRPHLDVGMPSLEGIHDAQPGICLFRVGREEEGQRVIVRAACGRRQGQRRGAERAGAAQQRPPIEGLTATMAGVRGGSPARNDGYVVLS